MLTNVFRLDGFNQVDWQCLVASKVSDSVQDTKIKPRDAKLKSLVAAHLQLREHGCLSACLARPSSSTASRVIPALDDASLWVFLPGRVTMTEQHATCLRDLTEVESGTWSCSSGSKEVGALLCEALTLQAARGLAGVGYTRFGRLFVRTELLLPVAISSREIQQIDEALEACELRFMASSEGVFVHVCMSLRNLRTAKPSDLIQPDRHEVLVAPGGWPGALLGECTSELALQAHRRGEVKVSRMLGIQEGTSLVHVKVQLPAREGERRGPAATLLLQHTDVLLPVPVRPHPATFLDRLRRLGAGCLSEAPLFRLEDVPTRQPVTERDAGSPMSDGRSSTSCISSSHESAMSVPFPSAATRSDADSESSSPANSLQVHEAPVVGSPPAKRRRSIRSAKGSQTGGVVTATDPGLAYPELESCAGAGEGLPPRDGWQQRMLLAHMQAWAEASIHIKDSEFLCALSGIEDLLDDSWSLGKPPGASEAEQRSLKLMQSAEILKLLDLVRQRRRQNTRRQIERQVQTEALAMCTPLYRQPVDLLSHNSCLPIYTPADSFHGGAALNPMYSAEPPQGMSPDPLSLSPRVQARAKYHLEEFCIPSVDEPSHSEIQAPPTAHSHLGEAPCAAWEEEAPYQRTEPVFVSAGDLLILQLDRGSVTLNEAQQDNLAKGGDGEGNHQHQHSLETALPHFRQASPYVFGPRADLWFSTVLHQLMPGCTAGLNGLLPSSSEIASSICCSTGDAVQKGLPHVPPSSSNVFGLSEPMPGNRAASTLHLDVGPALEAAFVGFGRMQGPLSLADWCQGSAASCFCLLGGHLANPQPDPMTECCDPITPPQGAASPAAPCSSVVDDSPCREPEHGGVPGELGTSADAGGGPDVADDLAIVTLGTPSVMVGYQDDWLLAAPNVLPLWEKAPLEPYSPRKAVVYTVLCPADPMVLQAAQEFFQHLSSVFETCHLGTHIPSLVAEDAIVGVPLPDDLLTNEAEARRAYRSSLQATCRRLSVIPPSACSQFNNEFESCTVVYVICPWNQASAAADLLVDATCAVAAMPCEPAEGGESSHHRSSSPKANMTLQLLCAEALLRSPRQQRELQELAFSVFSRARRTTLPTPSPTACALSETRPTASSLASPLQTIKEPRFLYEPLVILGQPGRMELNGHLQRGATLVSSQQAPLRQAGSVRSCHSSVGSGVALHCCYDWASVSGTMCLVAVWTDGRGEVLESHVAPSLPHGSATLLQLLQQGAQLAADGPRELVMLRLGLPPPQEINDWSKVLLEQFPGASTVIPDQACGGRPTSYGPVEKPSFGSEFQGLGSALHQAVLSVSVAWLTTDTALQLLPGSEGVWPASSTLERSSHGGIQNAKSALLTPSHCLRWLAEDGDLTESSTMCKARAVILPLGEGGPVQAMSVSLLAYASRSSCRDACNLEEDPDGAAFQCGSTPGGAIGLRDRQVVQAIAADLHSLCWISNAPAASPKCALPIHCQVMHNLHQILKDLDVNTRLPTRA